LPNLKKTDLKNLNEKIFDKLGKQTQKQLTMLVVGMGVLASLLVGLLLSGAFDEPEVAKEEPKVPMARIVVAKQDIPQRSIVQETMLQVTEVPANTLPPDAITDVATVVGKPVMVPIMQGDMLTSKKVLVDMKMAGFTGLIPEDCRAISVGIDDVTGIAGFARPGDYVDVMIVRKEGNDGGASGEIFMQNVMLLAINKSANPQTASSGGNDKEKKDGKKDDKKDGNSGGVTAGDTPATATLAMRAEDALRLAVALQQGKIYLSLRPYRPQDPFVLDTEFSIAGKTPVPADANANANNNVPKQNDQGSTQKVIIPPEVSAPEPEQPVVEVWNGDSKG
jgi:pilus assembly protein CpaB